MRHPVHRCKTKSLKSFFLRPARFGDDGEMSMHRLIFKARWHGRRRPRGHARGHPLAKVVRAPLGLLRGRVVHHHVLKDDILHGHRAVGQNHARVALGLGRARVYRDIAQRHVDVILALVGSVALGARDLMRPAQRARDITLNEALIWVLRFYFIKPTESHNLYLILIRKRRHTTVQYCNFVLP